MLKYFLPILLLTTISFNTYAQQVYKTPSGKKYHLASCHMVKNVSEKLSLEEATELGLEPCKICKPEVGATKTPAPNKAQGQHTTSQCKGLTKSGTRCKHKTSIANGYCYQHQP